jgi:phage nucleotide-binding protein
MDVRTADQYATAAKPNIVIYGAPGVGKTVLAAQAPKPCLLLDLDRGARYVTNAAPVDPEGLSIATGIKMEELWAMAENVALGKPFKYVSLVIDSLTELQNIHRGDLLQKRLAPTREEYRVNTEFIRRIIRMLQAAEDLTIVYTCLEREVEDTEGLLIRPAITPALLRNVEAVVGVIVYLGMREVATGEEEGGSKLERIAVTQGTNKIRAKDRTGLLPTAVLNPTWETLFGNLYTEGG